MRKTPAKYAAVKKPSAKVQPRAPIAPNVSTDLKPKSARVAQVAPEKTPLDRVLEIAFRGDGRRLGDTEPLETLLTRFSKLPGERPNMELARSFSELVSSREREGMLLAEFFASMDEDAAPGATAREYLPMLGVLTLGLLGAKHEGCREVVLKDLETLAEDFRFRVREAVPEALAEIGRVRKAALIEEVIPWCDGYFQTAAVLRALTDPKWLHEIHDGEPVVELLRGAFLLLKKSTRAMLRYPGYKALVETLGRSLVRLAVRFGDPVVQEINAWATQTSDPDLRALVARVTSSPKLKQRFAGSLDQITGSLEISKTPPRDPTLIRQGTRGRGKRKNYSRD